MAADTAQKRLSAMTVSLPWRVGSVPLPSGAVPAAQRIQLLCFYSGIAAGVATTFKKRLFPLLKVGF